MKKTKDVSDEDEYSADDPEEVEGASEEDWETGAEVSTRRAWARASIPFTVDPASRSPLLDRPFTSRTTTDDGT